MMKILFRLCLVSIALLFSLTDTVRAQPSAASGKTTPNNNWLRLFNSHIENLDSTYLPNAVILTSSGAIYATGSDRKRFYADFKKANGIIKSVTTIRKVDVTPNLAYEIGSFITGNNTTFTHLIIWRKAGDSFLRELEIFNEQGSHTVDVAGIDAARAKWMERCNSHQVDELVRNSYYDNAVYYNDGRLVKGTADITREYRYMSNPSYQLTLTPIIVEGAGEGLAFEIGQCSGSYKGKYMLVWGKRNGGLWKAIFDSN